MPAKRSPAARRCCGCSARGRPCSSAGSSERVAGAQVAYFRDVTRADELDRAKSRFVATAAHELRTPIAVITGYAEYLQSSDPPPSQRGEILATMRRHGDQIAGIVSELLDLARIEARAGRDFTMIRQPLAPGGPALHRFVPHRRIRARAELEGEIGDAEAFVDADKFCQALSNVIAERLQVLAAWRADRRAAGRGRRRDRRAASRIAAKAWTRRRSAASSSGSTAPRTRPASPGTGLGMSIVKEILDIHGGRIEIESAPGHGTAVTLWLPRAGSRG